MPMATRVYKLTALGNGGAAVEIEVALIDKEAQLHRVRRRVLLPVRPLDLVELFDPASAVSGGSEDGDEGELDEDGTALAGGASAECLGGPCGNMTLCQATGCAAKLGRYGASVDTLLADWQENDAGFCAYKPRIPISLRWLINNPNCR